MKKYLLILLVFVLCPCVVMADETCAGVSYDAYCKGSSCLSSLQSEYNTWSSTGNTGKACIKVIAKIDGNTKTYLSGKNPEINYICSDGTTASSELMGTPIPKPDEVTDCEDETCYVPEIWAMDCGGNTSTNTGNNSSGNASIGNSSGNNSSGNISTDNSNNNAGNINDDVNTNNNGQITGTTDASDTGVETYFIVLFVMVIVSYLILVVSKRKNLFKNI